jgi:hypothetical protein
MPVAPERAGPLGNRRTRRALERLGRRAAARLAALGALSRLGAPAARSLLSEVGAVGREIPVGPAMVRPGMTTPARPGVATTAAAVVAYAVAMAFVESAVVVYLQRALDIDPREMFPVRDRSAVGELAAIEVGREAATMVMLGAAGWLAGRSGLERLAWTAVAFGTWDIAYYAWLAAFIGWPTSLATWDLLFLIPVPWAGPVAAPVAVSVALVGFGLVAAARLRAGLPVRAGPAEFVAGIGGGALVVLSFCWNAPLLFAGGVPRDFPWPVFAAGMALAAWGASSAIARAPTAGSVTRTPAPPSL